MCRIAADALPNHWPPARPTVSRGVWALLTRAGAVWSVCAAATVFANCASAFEVQSEIQINLCSEPERVVQGLDMTEKGRPTTVWLFDTRAQDLHRNGLRVRLRERGRRSDLTLKVAGQDCLQVDPALLKPDGKCEADLHGDTFDDVVSLTRPLDARARAELLAPDAGRGAALASALISHLDSDQLAWLARRRGVAAGSPYLPQDLARLGPSMVRAYRSATQPYSVEVWTLPGGERFIELSQKVRRDVALPRRAEIQKQIVAAGVTICADQDSQAQKKLAILAR